MRPVERLIRKLEARDPLTAAEKAALTAAAEGEETYDAGEDVILEGRRQSLSRLLADGMIARAKTLPDGRRQITALHIPGDFVDLHSFLLKRLDHDVVSLTPSRFVTFPHAALKQLTEAYPHLTRMLWLSTVMDAAIHRAWIVSSGRMTSIEQIGSLFCELHVRFDIVGLVRNGAYPLRITQEQLADCCGLSPVHVNRVVQNLRDLNLVKWRSGSLWVLDFEALAALSLFNPDYLVLNREPR